MLLVKAKWKVAGVDVYPFKLVQQETLGAYSVLERCLCLFRLIAGEKDHMVATIQSKGVVDIGHVVQMQFFYKYFLRLVNHWNFAHGDLVNDAAFLSLERNLLSTISEKVVCGLLGVVVNELDFLRAHLLQQDTTGSLAHQMTQEDRVFDITSSAIAASAGAAGVSSSSEGWVAGVVSESKAPTGFRAVRLDSFRKKAPVVSPPLTPREKGVFVSFSIFLFCF
jgi:hypothetical protein